MITFNIINKTNFSLSILKSPLKKSILRISIIEKYISSKDIIFLKYPEIIV